MANGIDYAWTHPPAHLVKTAGFGFVARYLSKDATKNLSRAEAEAILGQGLELVVVWESGAQDMLRGRSGGVADAQMAVQQAEACGLGKCPIYFAADWDAAPDQQLAINTYLEGAGHVIGLGRVGMYGGYWPVARARAAGVLSYTWGTVAWSGGNWDPKVNPHTFQPDIMQGAQLRVAGISVDLDQSHGHTHQTRPGDYGQFPRPPAPKAVAGRHEATGHASIRHVADRTRVTSVILATARHQPGGWGKKQDAYLTAGNWDAPMPAGMVVWLPEGTKK